MTNNISLFYLYSFDILHVIITILSVVSLASIFFFFFYLVINALIIKSLLVVGTEWWETEPRGIQWQQHCLPRRCFWNPYFQGSSQCLRWQTIQLLQSAWFQSSTRHLQQCGWWRHVVENEQRIRRRPRFNPNDSCKRISILPF